MLGRILLASSLLMTGASVSAQTQSPGSQSEIPPPSEIQEVKPLAPLPQLSFTQATAQELEDRADLLKEQKNYLDAIDYYRAALKKHQNSAITERAVIENKIGMTYLLIGNMKAAEKALKRAVKTDKKYPEAYNNLGVAYYGLKKYRPAEKNYKKAIELRESASFHSNLGTLYMERKKYQEGMAEYEKAYQLDPGVFERSSRNGISARMGSPGDQARFFYVMAKLFAANGKLDKSLEYLKKSLEDGYPDIDKVYKDADFATLRKDQRFTELMAQRPVAIPQ
ncbi:MAG: tetratricopeptide repeat protein [Terriglobia bacterium]|nr:tetratricopeptide repeat protein [Terriglobia bacterium]